MTGYKEVNAGLKSVVEYLNSIENVWNKTRTLKLYNVSFQAAAIIEKYPLVKEEYSEYDLFSWFCEDEYSNFIEWMKEEKRTDCREYIGRTSSFYLTDLHDSRIDYVLSNLLDKLYGGYYVIDIDENGQMIPFTDTDNYTESELIEEYQEGMDYIASGEFLQDIKKYLSDAIEIASYIDGFMKNQVETFTEYIDCKNEVLEEIAAQEQAEENAFIEKYGEIITNMTAIIEDFIKVSECTPTDASRIMHKALENVTIEDKAELKTA